MSHQALLGVMNGPNRWEARHIHWALPEWTLPELHACISEHRARGFSLTEAMQATWDEDIALGYRYDRWPDLNAPGDGWGRVWSHRANPQMPYYQWLFLLDPTHEMIRVRFLTACPIHAPLYDARDYIQNANWVCPTATSPDPPGVRVHRKHRVRGCDCYCFGQAALRFDEILTYPAHLSEVADALVATAEHGSARAEDVLRSAASIRCELGDDALSVWASLCCTLGDHFEALEVARSVCAGR